MPAPILVAIWGLETGFGGGTGNTPAIRSLVTLAHDCRRSAFFTNELMAALEIVQRGDLTPAAMKGGWAGEIGQTQFLPSSYVKYGIDYDGNGRVDLIHSWADALASTANYLRAMAGRPARPGARAPPTSTCCIRGTRQTSTVGRSSGSPSISSRVRQSALCPPPWQTSASLRTRLIRLQSCRIVGGADRFAPRHREPDATLLLDGNAAEKPPEAVAKQFCLKMRCKLRHKRAVLHGRIAYKRPKTAVTMSHKYAHIILAQIV